MKVLTTFRHALFWMRGQILGWGLGIAALGLLLVPFYDVFMERQTDFLQMIESYPPEFLAFFGGDAAAIATPEGYLGMYGFSLLPIIVGIFALLVGSGLLAGDEEAGRMDLILAHPVSRRALFWGRLAAFAVASAAIAILGWLGFAILLSGSSLEISALQMALPFVPVLAQTLIYGTLAALLSMLLPTRRLAAMLTGVVMVISYIASSMSGLDKSLASLAKYLPYEYFQGGEAIDGLDLASFLILMAASAVLALLTWWRFERRDVRVAGEGSWELPWPRKSTKLSSRA
jgi:ABC-2 type transport system permease protein